MDLKEKQQKLEEIAKQVTGCKRCGLYKNATNPVPGEGNSEAEIMFVGEGPGFWEDKKGRPFVGQAGKLLDDLLQLIKVRRKDVWIGNLIKHRPPGNRDPLPEEIKACSIWINKQIEIISPKIIVTLGRFSMSKFLLQGKITQIHGTPYEVDWEGRKITVFPMYHPAAALRNAKIMKEIKEDFLKLKNEIS